MGGVDDSSDDDGHTETTDTTTRKQGDEYYDDHHDDDDITTHHTPTPPTCVRVRVASSVSVIDNCSVLPWSRGNVQGMYEAIVVGEPLRIVTESDREAWPRSNIHDELITVCVTAEILSYILCLVFCIVSVGYRW